MLRSKLSKTHHMIRNRYRVEALLLCWAVYMYGS